MRNLGLFQVEVAKEGATGPTEGAAQGIKARWTGCGTGIIVRSADRQDGHYHCEVAPDDPRSF
jgi:hypothetical protein